MEQLKDRIPLSLTYVSYVKGDSVGKVLAYLTLAPFFFAIVEFGFVLCSTNTRAKRNVAIMMLLGQFLNEFINALLKAYLKEVRPIGTERSDYGMPSSHSQFMGYLAANAEFFLGFTVFNRLPKFVSRTLIPLTSWAVCFSRIYLGYHDLRQVTVGFFAGLVFGLLWSNVLRLLAVEPTKAAKKV